jgi:putative flippase GtrA
MTPPEPRATTDASWKALSARAIAHLVLGALLDRTAARYMIAGAACNLALLALYYLLTLGFRVNPNLGLTIAAALVFPLAFFVSRAWTFGSSVPLLRAFAHYGGSYALSWLLQSGILFVGYGLLGAPHYFMAPAGLAIATLTFFLVQRFWIFRR